MSDNDRSQVLEMVVAFGIGLVAGAAAALLLAPASGAESRRRIGELARNVSGKVRERTREAGERLREGTEKMRRTVRQEAEGIGHAYEEGKKAYEREGRT